MNDLEQILESIASTQANILSRLAALESKQGAGNARDWGFPATTYGTVVPTDPPSTSVIVKRGAVWCYAISGGGSDPYQVAPVGWKETRVDLADYVDEFLTAFYYRWAILAMNLQVYPVDFGIWESTALYPIEAEFENQELASRDFDGEIIGACNIDLTDTFYDGCLALPLAALILRNDGVTGAPGHILPITYGDRERSIIMQDFRPWMNLVGDYVC